MTDTTARELSQRDVVFTPFMLRIRDVLDGTDRSAPLRLRASSLRPVAEATDEWFYLRARCEQVIAEANAMLHGRAAPVDLQDEYGTGELGFVLRRGARSVRISLGCADRQAWVELRRLYAPDARPVEPEEPAVLEDLVVELLAGPAAEEEP
jgi:hypothetical protein